jgi:3-oxoacyl-[acyl-carrier-protein] synthase I
MMQVNVRIHSKVRYQLFGFGMATALGDSPQACSAAIRASVTGICTYPEFPARYGGELFSVASHEGLGSSPVTSRMMDLASTALLPTLSIAHGTKLPLLISLPPVRPGWDARQAVHWFDSFLNTLHGQVDRSRSSLLTTGHHGTIALLNHAIALIERDEAPACIVGGVDSWLDQNLLDWLNQQSRLKSSENSNGFVPGEGAAFFIVAPDTRAPKDNALHLLAAGEVYDPTPWYIGLVPKGDGTSALFQALLTDEMPKADRTYSDQNGEPWRTDEWAVAYLRTGAKHGHPLNHVHPASFWGDLGAASGAALVAHAATDLQRVSPAKADNALVYTSCDTRPFRSACMLGNWSKRQ